MGSFLRSCCCSCFRGEKQREDQTLPVEIKRPKLEITLVEGSLQSTSCRVPEQFRMKIDSLSEDSNSQGSRKAATMPCHPSGRTSHSSANSWGHGSSRMSSDASFKRRTIERSNSGTNSRHRPKNHAPHVPPPPPKPIQVIGHGIIRPEVKDEEVMGGENESDEDEGETVMMDNEIYGDV